MTVLDLLFLAAITFGMLILAAVTPQSYRSAVYLVLIVSWGFVLIYLMAPPGFLDQKLSHWMR